MSIDMQILVPDGVVVEAQIAAFRATDPSGSFGLLSHHQKFLTLLVPCVITFREEGGRERYAASDGGVLLMTNDRITIFAREAVVADKLDQVAEAAESMLEARLRQEETARTEFAGLRARLLREMTDIERHESDVGRFR